MGFTVRFLLVVVLVLQSCWSLESANLKRQRRQISDSVKVVEDVKKSDNGGESHINGTNLTNLTEVEDSKPKTDVSTESNLENIDRRNNLVNRADDLKSNDKLKKSESYNKDGIKEETKSTRENIGRSIDIDKYVSKEFHSRNNVYTVPLSADTEKYINHDYDYHSTTHNLPDHSKDFTYNSELTTPKSSIFDSRYKDAVDSVDQTLEHIDSGTSKASEEETFETNVDKLLDETKNNETKAKLNYVNYKSILSNDTANANSLHKDVVVEAGTNLDFQSDYNKTKLIDEKSPDSQETKENSPKGEFEKVEVSTVKNNFVLTTRKSVTLTKPPSNKNSSHISILSNKIETETVKAIDPLRSRSVTTPMTSTTERLNGGKEASSEVYTRRSPSDITKRGSIKFIDYAKPSSTESSNTKYTRSRVRNRIQEAKANKSAEQLVQENQIIPIHVEAPSNMDRSTAMTTESSKETETTAFADLGETTIEAVTPETITETTTDFLTTTQEFLTTRELETTTSETTTTLDTTTTTVEPSLSTTEIPIFSTRQEGDYTTEASFEVTTTTEIDPVTKTALGTRALDDATTSLVVETTTELMLDETTLEPTSTVADLETVTTASPQVDNINKTSTSPGSTTTEGGSRTSKGFVFNDTTNQETLPEVSTDRLTTEPMISEELPDDSQRKNNIVKLNDTIATTTEELVTDYDEDKSEEIDSKKLEPITTTTTTTTEIVIVHIDEEEINHTTFMPVFKSDYNYPTIEVEASNDNVTTTESSEIVVEDNSGTIAAITISTIGAICLILLAGLLFLMRKRQKRFNYGQRCTPVSLDDYSMDNISVYNSVRRKAALRSSKRSYGNPAFEDPSSVSHPLNFPALGKFANNSDDIKAEFEEIPQITARTNELPEGCDTKNRYANVIPLPETRVFLTAIEGYPNSDYINANYVTGPKNVKGYYIACQAPMLNTVDDFWRMIWEQQSKVILMLTHLYENGVEKCVDYLPPSEVLDCHRLFGDFQVTLKKREVKDKYIISIVQLKNMVSNSWREVTHFWYLGWPDKGVPSEPNSLIAFLIEARSYMKSSSIDRKEVTAENLSNGNAKAELNPVVVHCSPGTGRTGAVIACDIAIREFELTRLVDVPRIVYKIRRDRASSVQTKDQYAFIYKVINLYATKLTGGSLDSL